MSVRHLSTPNSSKSQGSETFSMVACALLMFDAAYEPAFLSPATESQVTGSQRILLKAYSSIAVPGQADIASSSVRYLFILLGLACGHKAENVGNSF